jgi:hypothetical protein
MKARRRRPSSRQRKRTRRHRCLGTRAFRLTRGSELVSPADAELLRGATADPPDAGGSMGLPARLPPFLAVRRAVVDPFLRRPVSRAAAEMGTRGCRVRDTRPEALPEGRAAAVNLAYLCSPTSNGVAGRCGQSTVPVRPMTVISPEPETNAPTAELTDTGQQPRKGGRRRRFLLTGLMNFDRRRCVPCRQLSAISRLPTVAVGRCVTGSSWRRTYRLRRGP